MIEIKLTFDTLEAAVSFLAKARAETTAPVTRDTPSGTVRPKQQPAADTSAAATKPATSATAESQPAGEKSAPGKPASTEPTAPAVQYKDVQAAVAKLAAIGANEEDEAKQVGRAAVKAVLKKMNLESFKGSPEGCWGTAVAELTAAHAILVAQG